MNRGNPEKKATRGKKVIKVIPATLITEEVVENGAIIGYLGFDENLWLILPDHTLGVRFAYATGGVAVAIDRIDGISVLTLFQDAYLRFLIIYPPAASKLKNVDTSDYGAVMKALEHQ